MVDAISLATTGSPATQHSPNAALGSAMGVSPSLQQNGPCTLGSFQRVQFVLAQTASVASLLPQSLVSGQQYVYPLLKQKVPTGQQAYWLLDPDVTPFPTHWKVVLGQLVPLCARV